MKKILILISLLLIFTPSCAKREAPSEYPERDRRFENQDSDIVETADAYYWHTMPNGPFIYYCDKASGASGVLCGKPECEHADPKICGGSADGAYCPSLFPIGDRLYWVALRIKPDRSSVYSLFSMKTDASDRRMEYDLDIKEDAVPYRIDFHLGEMYIYGVTQIVEGAEPKTVVSIQRIPIGSEETKVIKTFELAPGASPRYAVRFEGDSVYYMFYHYGGRETPVSEIWRYSISEDSFELVFSAEGVKLRDFYPDGERILASVLYSDGRPADVYVIENGEMAPLFDFGGEDFFCDSVVFSDGIVIGESFPEGEPAPTLWIKDFEGKTLYLGKLPTSFLSGFEGGVDSLGLHALCGNAAALFADLEVYTDAVTPYTDRIHCLLRYDFTDDGLKETLLCSETLTGYYQ